MWHIFFCLVENTFGSGFGGLRWAITWRFLLGSVDRLVGGSLVSRTLGRWWCFGLEERITGLYAAICKANEKPSLVKYSLLFRSLVLNVPLF